MRQSNKIFEALISSRNILLGNRTNEHLLLILGSALKDAESIEIDYSRNIISYCIREAVEQIEASRFKSAGLILNLIHNLPLEDEELSRWDVDYFLSMELPTFLDNYGEIRNSRNIALYVCSMVANQYLPRE
ncbi:hypothetical protein M5C99_08440 [Acidovorax sp. NCPPB 2350]|nr:hypothetical protein M5C99_08440 [Acidovorax sp. NCPPB 2350]